MKNEGSKNTKIIEAIADFNAAERTFLRRFNSRSGWEASDKRANRAAKHLLRLVLNREPTDEEIQKIRNG